MDSSNFFYIENNDNISVFCKFRNSEIEKVISEVFAFLSLWPKINNLLGSTSQQLKANYTGNSI
jgi:hypothetical protein